jgi:predicted Zn finger-like uncharacterized protein
MVITVTCPSCSSSFPVDSSKIPEGGVNARCTSCSDIFRIDKPVEAEPLPTLEEVAPPPPEPVVEEPEAVEEPAAIEQPAAFEEPAAPAVVDSPDEWVVENEELPAIEAEPLPDIPEAAPEVAPPVVEAPASDPFAEPAPFEAPAAPEVAESLPAPPAPEPPAAPEAPAAPQGFTFGKRDPTDKAKRLARVLVSDMIMYNAERHQNALAAGTLVPDFEEEIEKSWKEFVEQVGEDLANGAGRVFWSEALNDILAKGEQVF